MKYFRKVAEDIDIRPLLNELKKSSDMWLVDKSRQSKVRCQRHTNNIFLRSAKKPLPAGAKNANDVHESRETRVARKFPVALQFCKNVAKAVDGDLGRSTLVALMPKSMVYPHIDEGEYYRIRDRFHLVLRSAHGSPLTTEGETIVMKEGELWVFNNKARHWAENNSPEPRVHLIFDVLPAPGKGFYAFPITSRETKSGTFA